MRRAKNEELKSRVAKSVRKPATLVLNKEDQLTKLVARKASKQAVRISKALDLSVQFIENGNIVEVRTGGERQVIKTIPRLKSKVKVFKGTTLCLKPKG